MCLSRKGIQSLQSSSHLGLCHAKTLEELRVLNGKLNDLQAETCKAADGCVRQQHEPVHPIHMIECLGLKGRMCPIVASAHR